MDPAFAATRLTTEDQAVACIEESLSLHLYDNARFIAERLVADFPNPRAKHLLATCCMQCGQLFQAVELLKGQQSPDCRYLLALCLMKLPGKLNEAAAALMPGRDRSQVPNGAAGFFQLGRISRLLSRPAEAVDYFSEALALDPLLWQAYEELCHLDCSKAEQWLKDGMEEAGGGNNGAWQQNGFAPFPASPQQPSGGFPGFTTSAAAQQTPTRLAFGSAAPSAGRYATLGFGAQQQTPHFAGFGTPSPFGGGPAATPAPPRPPTTAASIGLATMSLHQQMQQPQFETPMASTPGNFVTPPPMANGTQPPVVVQNRNGGIATPVRFGSVGATPVPAAKAAKRGKLGMGARLDFAASGSSWFRNRGAPPSQQAATLLGQPDQPDSRGAAAGITGGCEFPGSTANGAAAEEQKAADDGGAAARELLMLLRALGRGLRLLCQYRCRDALIAFQQLPPTQLNTGWVWCQLGRAHFEMVEYAQAVQAFEHARALDPQRLEGMEVYSTVLWHLRREVALAHLAQQAVATDRRSPAAWCVVGNCFSLQKEHESALRFFQRALQVDPTYVYAYTLAGHEYFATEDFNKALAAYQHALRLDARHYNAWYGIGQIYMRQEKWQEAEHHFRRAADINQRSSVLHCYTGMALFKQGLHAEALQRLQIAIKVDARNPLARFERAAVLEDQGRLQEALAQLHSLKELAPREGSLYFKMGRIHRRLNQMDEAISAFTTALDLKPSSADASLIKSAIEKISADNADEEEL